MEPLDVGKIRATANAFVRDKGRGSLQSLADAAGVERMTLYRFLHGKAQAKEATLCGIVEALDSLGADVRQSKALDIVLDKPVPPQAPELFPGATAVVGDLRRIADLIEQTKPGEVYPLRTIEAGLQGVADSLPDLRELIAQARQQLP